jgi:type III secretion system low calcium response chaperone LcrH/SycD
LASSDSKADAKKEASLAEKLQQWADGKATLKDVRGYSDEELYSIARTAYYFYYQGRLDEARTLFQGLYAVNPLDAYFARALGVVELAAGNSQGALTAYDVAIKLAPGDPEGYAGRAEVHLAAGQKPQALEDLRRANQLCGEEHAIKPKVSGMLAVLSRR